MFDINVNGLTEIIPNASDYVLIVRDGVWYRAKVSNIANGGVQKLPAPISFNAELLDPTTLVLSWSNVSNNNGYSVEKSTNNNTWTLVSNTLQNVTNLTLGNLQNNTVYYFRVKAIGTAQFLDSDWKNKMVTL